jgi:hypothetical protein
MNRQPRLEAGPAERVRIPADVDREDRLLAGLTARQLAILAAAAVVLWLAWAATRQLIPLPVFAGLAAPAAGAAVALAVGRRHGLPADRLLAAMLRQHFAPRRLIPAPDGIPTPPSRATEAFGWQPLQLGPLGLPVQAIAGDGTLDLGSHGTAMLAQATAVSFALRTSAEREALAAGYGRYLNSLSTPVQILLGAEPVDLRPVITEVRAAAPGLPHPLLEAACREHADYLEAFAASRPLLRREVLLVLRAPTPTAGAKGRSRQQATDTPVEDVAAATEGVLARVSSDAAAALAGAGVSLTVLDGPAAAARLARALNPNANRLAAVASLPDAVITGGRR